MSSTLESCCELCGARRRSRVSEFLHRLYGLMPRRAETYMTRAQERALDDPETRERWVDAAARRQWNPPSWWDHL